MKRILSLITILLLPAGLPQAATSADSEAVQFFEEEAVVIAASKRAQRITETAANASVITANDIEAYGYRTMGEALQSIPGFYATDDRNYGRLWVRGFGRPGDYNSRVLLLINGHRMNDNIYGQAFIGQEFSLDMNSISRIEIVKGPGAALYGDNALFAVVNVITKTAEDAAGEQVVAEGASYGAHKEFAAVAHRFGNGLSMYASGAYRNMLGQTLRYPEFDGVNGGVSWKMNDREKNGDFYLNLSGGGWLLQGSANRRIKGIPTASFGATFNDFRSKTVDTRSFLELQRKIELSEALALTERVYYDLYDYRGYYISDNANPPPDQLTNHDSAINAWYGQETRLQYDFGKENILTVGQEYEKNAVGSQQSYSVSPYQHYLDANLTPHRWAVFVQQELKLRSDLNLTLGARHDRYKSFGKAFNPRIAAVYNPWEGNALKLMAGSAFRAPSPYEMLYSYPGTNKDNLSLRPEKVKTYEAYWEHQLPERFGSVALGYFRNHITGLISQITDPNDGMTQFVNEERILSKGVELTSHLRVSDRVSGHIGYILQKTKQLGGSRLSNSPERSGTAGLTAQLGALGATAGTEVFIIGSRRTYQDTYLPPAALLSLNLSAQPWKAGPRCYAGVHNLTNTAYRATGSAEHVQVSILQDRRNYTVGLDYKF
jgi:iron complex outermembrane receptor protein